jgi:Tol biopolymer transport system component/DNA-binding winged helix-turn-helix (wHTH) protein
VNLRAGELRRDGTKIKLQEQPFKVLAMLLERPGEIVTREELEKALWSADTFVDFEHGLNKAINKIREALDDSADNPRFVETLARRGYRFIYPVAPVSPPAADVGAIHELPLPKTSPRAIHESPVRKRSWLAFAAVAIVAVLFALNVAGVRDWILRRATPTKSALPPMKVVPFTSFPGYELYPVFSPEGNQIAFTWSGEKDDNWDIYVKLIGAERPLRLTTDPRDEYCPAWSPDGRYIAFWRHGEREDGIWTVPALGGPERKLRSLNVGSDWRLASLAWSPDGKYIAYVDRRPGQQGTSLFMLAVDNPDDTRALTFPGGPLTADYGPRFSPDGSSVAFGRSLNRGDVMDVYVVRAAGGEPKRLTFDNVFIGGLDWTPDGGYIVFSSDRLGVRSLWKVRASGGEPEPLPVGQGGAWFPSLSRIGRRLAYAQSSEDVNIWRYEVPRVPGLSTPPTKLIASTHVDLSQQFSPDGKRIVFASGRSGSVEIWVCDSDGSNPRQLTFFGGSGTPRWSPDGQQIAFDSEREGHSDIYVVHAEGGQPRRLTTESSNDVVPSWSRDGRWIYFASDRTSSFQVWKMPAEGGRAVQVTKQGGFAAFESSDGKTLYYAKGEYRPGLWKVPVEGGEETLVLEQPAAGLWGYWGLRAEGIFFYNATTKAIEFFSFATNKITQIAKPEKQPDPTTNPGFAVSPDGRWILYAQADQLASDIMLVENFRW